MSATIALIFAFGFLCGWAYGVCDFASWADRKNLLRDLQDADGQSENGK